ncbi:MAG: hypothetical protein WCJ18_08875 [Planctomycetota bacterium]
MGHRARIATGRFALGLHALRHCGTGQPEKSKHPAGGLGRERKLAGRKIDVAKSLEKEPDRSHASLLKSIKSVVKIKLLDAAE